MKNPISIPSTVATIEISSSCNAKCRWCTTGSKNRICQAKPEFMSPELFERGLNRLFDLGWITQETKIELYNWGEPFLHPKLDEILHILAGKGLRFYLSTNGSIYRKLPLDVLKNMELLMVSIPGMSKDSYEKIHRLDMETVHENIRKFSADLKAAGVGEKLYINFHVYQFNLSELSSARQFAEELGATFTPNMAYFNDYRMAQSFLTGTMQRDELYEAATQLFLHGYQKSGSDKKAHCRLWNQVCFDHAFNLVPCCRLTTDERLGNLFADRPENLIDARIDYEECRSCIESGQCKSIVEGGLQEGWYLLDRNKMYREALDRLAAQNAEQEKLIRLQGGRVEQLENQNDTLRESVEQEQARVEQLEEQNRYLSENFDTISNSTCWKITKPIRVVLDTLKALPYKGKEYVSLAKKAFVLLRTQGIKAVLEKYRQRKRYLNKGYNLTEPERGTGNSFVDHAAEEPEPVIPQEWIDMQRQKPLISIVIAAKHQETRAAYLKKALVSLCKQRYQNLEAILVADATDMPYVQELIRSFDGQISLRSVKLECETQNRWAYWSEGVSAARGELIGFLEQEDTLAPNCLAYVLEAYNESIVRHWELYLIQTNRR